MRKRYVNCMVAAGMFENELYVVVDESAVYVSKGNVRIDGTLKGEQLVKGSVLAYVVEEQPEKSLVQLPGEPVVGTSRTWVPNTRLATA